MDIVMEGMMNRRKLKIVMDTVMEVLRQMVMDTITEVQRQMAMLISIRKRMAMVIVTISTDTATRRKITVMDIVMDRVGTR